MKTKNLIALGALCQKQFNMADGFEIIEFKDYDIPHSVTIRYSLDGDATLLPITTDVSPIAPGILEEKVELSLFGSNKDNEFAWAGYSTRAKTLCIVVPNR